MPVTLLRVKDYDNIETASTSFDRVMSITLNIYMQNIFIIYFYVKSILVTCALRYSSQKALIMGLL